MVSLNYFVSFYHAQTIGIQTFSIANVIRILQTDLNSSGNYLKTISLYFWLYSLYFYKSNLKYKFEFEVFEKLETKKRKMLESHSQVDFMNNLNLFSEFLSNQSIRWKWKTCKFLCFACVVKREKNHRFHFSIPLS